MAEKYKKSDYKGLLEELDSYLDWPDWPAVYNYYESYIALETREELAKFPMSDDLKKIDIKFLRTIL